MAAPSSGQPTLVQRLATLLRNNGDMVLDGSSVLTLRASCLQHLTWMFEQHLVSRTQQHGFLALPSHPADTSSLLQVQFLFDMLQKTVSLKLVNPPGCKLQSVVKIFPFKSLRYLELKRVPPHCLEGLRAVYSQLHVFVCSGSINSLEELLSLCGGDLSSALPWLELHTLNFSYNSILSLDRSLSLLNVLKFLDLSHNRIQECEEFLLPLSELEYLNLGYNHLQRVPLLGLSSRSKLHTLFLCNNELETINGVEQLSNLQHLDLSYNLLMEHVQLTPLSLLHCLVSLKLEGNPLCFQKSHRHNTVKHLSPKAALMKLKLDGCFLSSSERAVLPTLRNFLSCVTQNSSAVTMVPERGAQEVSSGGGDLSDSLSVSEPRVLRPLKKARSKVKVRRVSISEPSDTDYDSRNPSFLQDFVLQHQEDIERMDVFRDQLGEDWLRYQHHLGGASVSRPYSSPLPERDPVPLVMPQLGQEAYEEMETDSTLQWPGHATENTESTLEMSVGVPRGAAPSKSLEEDDENLGVDLCLPLLVAVLPEEGEVERKVLGPLFLRVKQGHALEIDTHTGTVLQALELDSLKEVETSQAVWMEKGEERILPALELHFTYISRARQRRRYVLLDEEPQQALQALADILSHIAKDNERQEAGSRAVNMRLQCLKCQAEFSTCSGPEQGEEAEVVVEQKKREDDQDGAAGHNTAALPPKAQDLLVCPECCSDHVVQLSICSAPSTSTPIFGLSEEDVSTQHFSLYPAQTPHQSFVPPVEENISAFPQASSLDETQLIDTFLSARGGTFYIGGDSSCSDGPASCDLIQCHSPEKTNDEAPPPADLKVEPAASWSYNYSAPQLQLLATSFGDECSPAYFDLTEDYEAVDHRLKLFLDVEVFETDNEELRCFLKMSLVKFGNPEEFPALLVLSDQRIYFLEITSQNQGQPSDWLRKRESHRLAELRCLEMGLGSQILHTEFESMASVEAYTLLVRDGGRCQRFFNLLIEIIRELAPKLDSKLRSISTKRLDPHHPLWHLVCETPECDSDNLQLQFFYLLAFIQQDDGLSPVTLLATQETLYLLSEDHQWRKSLTEPIPDGSADQGGGKVVVLETRPISCVSSIQLFSSKRYRVDIRIFDEVVKEERTWILHTESVELLQELVSWLKTHWEAMFGVKLSTSLEGSES